MTKDFIVSKEILFGLSLIFQYAYLLIVGWSIGFPKRRIWPPPRKWSSQYLAFWILYGLAILTSIPLIILDWNTWLEVGDSRLFLGFPFLVTGTFFAYWGIKTLGVINTSGLKDGFTVSGPYKFTRNPQYIGYILQLFGGIIIINSFYVLILFLVLILTFFLMPLAEEVWLEEMYGEEYLNYKMRTPRFL